MKKYMFMLIALVAFALLLSVSAPVKANPNQIPVTSYEYDCFTGLESEWVDGQVYHMRNVSHTNIEVSDTPELNGINTTLADAEFNLKTGVVVIRGTMSLQPNGMDGTWEGTWVYINNHGIVKGSSIAHGTGVLSGKTLFLSIYDAPYNPETETMCAGIGIPEGNVVAEGYILE